MPRISLDHETADRILDGAVRPADAPPGYERLCEMLDVLREAPAHAEAHGIAPASRPAATPGSGAFSRRMPRWAVAFAAAVSLTGGVALGAGLPETASRAASDVLERLGVNVPGSQRSSQPVSQSSEVRSSAQMGRPASSGPSSLSRPGDTERKGPGTATTMGEKKGAKKSSGNGPATGHAAERPGQGHGRGGRHGGQPPGHGGQPPGHGGQPPGQAGKPGNPQRQGTGPPDGHPAAGGPKHTNPGGETTPPGQTKRGDH